MDEAELARLLRAALAGDEKAYAAFLHAAAGLVRAFARRRTGQGGIDPEDIVQETLLAVHVKRHTWRADAPVTPWLYAIARYKLIDAFRRRGRRIDVDIDEIAETLAAAPEPDRPSEREIGKALDAGAGPALGRFGDFGRGPLDRRDGRKPGHERDGGEGRAASRPGGDRQGHFGRS